MNKHTLEFTHEELAIILTLMDVGVRQVGLQALQGDSLLHVHAVQNKIREAASTATAPPPAANGGSKNRKKVGAANG